MGLGALMRTGAVLLVVGGAATAGWTAAARLRRRPRELRQIQTGLHVLRTEIDWGAVPLPAALARAGGCLEGPTARIFAEAAAHLAGGEGLAAGEAWERALAAAGPETALTPGDVEILRALAVSLGTSHREDQVRHLEVCLGRLAEAEQRARERADADARLYQQLGVLGGLLLALLAL